VAVPSDIAGLEAWFKADAIVGKADGDALSQWDDSSGNGVHLTQATGSFQPTYQTNELNALPVVRFDGTDDRMSVAVAADASRTVFVVAKQAADASQRMVLGFGAGNTSRLGRILSAQWGYAQNAAGGNVDLGGTPTDWTTVTLRVNSAASLDAYVDGGAPTNFDPHDTISTATSFGIGARGDGTQLYWNGDIAEAFFFNTALSDVDRESMEDYLTLKWFTVPADPPNLQVVQSSLRLA
jgi:hypothetical protein